MRLTEIQKAKLTAEVKKLTEKADFLEHKARAENEAFLSLTRICGCEFTDSLGTEYDYQTVKNLGEEAEFLQDVRDGRILLDEAEHIKTRIEKIEEEMCLLKKEKAVLEVRKQRFENLEKLIF